jgi:hypothetical protein
LTLTISSRCVSANDADSGEGSRAQDVSSGDDDGGGVGDDCVSVAQNVGQRQR